MNIQTAAKYMQQGYRITRPCWVDRKIHLQEFAGAIDLMRYTDRHFDADVVPYYRMDDFMPSIDDLLADDWEIITDDIVRWFPITYSD